MTLPAVDNPERVVIAIGDMLQVVLSCIRPYKEAAQNSSGVTSRTLGLDSRIQIDSPWAFVDDSMTPISFFNAP